MRIFFIILYIVSRSLTMQAQSPMIAIYKDSLDNAKEDTARARFLYKLSYYYQYYKPDSALLLAQSSHTLSIRSKFLKGQAASLGVMAGAFNRMGNYSKALEYYIEQLKIVEKQTDKENIAGVYLSIALVYNSQKDAAKSLYYAYKADSIARTNKLTEIGLYTSLDIGEIYSDYDRLDSALLYTKRCYTESIKQKDFLVTGIGLYNMIDIYFTSGLMKSLNSFKDKDLYQQTANHQFDLLTGTALNNMGNIYFKSGNYDKALYYLKSSVPYLDSMQDYNTLAECYLGMAMAFDKLQMPDSAFYYGNSSFRLASNNQFLKLAINASAFLTQLYKQQNQVDSAFAYTQTYMAFKDSFDNTEKIKQLQSLTISEQLRQQQIVEEQIQEHKDRRLKLELLLIGTFIPIFFFISVYLSRQKVHKKVIQFLGIFSLLLLFEYITFLIHPVVANATGHSAALEILIFVAIAAIISPAHHRIEHWLTNKLAERHASTLRAAAKAAHKKMK